MSEQSRHDVAVIGGGILGVAHAYEAVRRGLSVVLLERNARPVGASVRNFGMVWPVGQAPGSKGFERAMRSRSGWLEAASKAGFWHEPVGSIQVARHEDEWAVLNEFVAACRAAGGSAGGGHRVELLSPGDACERSPGLVRDGLIGALYSSTEVCVDPRQAVHAITEWLRSTGKVTVRTGCPVRSIAHPYVETAWGERYSADRIIVCSGEDLRTLYPEQFATSGMVTCKLQMMRTVPQPGGWRLGPMLAAGSTQRHYTGFEVCPSLARVRARFSAERPEFDALGIHVMASQHGDGTVTLGDSHEYADPPPVYNREEIDDLVLEYLRGFVRLPDARVAERWAGVYVKMPLGATEWTASPEPGVRLVNGVGGLGMTFSFGLAHETFDTF